MTRLAPTSQYLRSRLTYDPATGVFTWRTSSRGAKAGTAAGGLHRSTGYIRIFLCGRSWRAHVLAWLYVTGEMPSRQIDHEDGDRSNNQWTNLRPASHSQNQQNQRGPQKDNPNGYLGVGRWRNGRYRAQIRVNGKAHHLGTFDTAEEAHCAYLEAKRRLHGHCTI